MLRAVAELIDDLRTPDGAAHQSLLKKVDEIATELATSPGLAIRRAVSLRETLNRPEARAWIGSSWGQLRELLLLRDLVGPSTQLCRIFALVIASLGEALRANAAMRERLDATLEALVMEALP